MNGHQSRRLRQRIAQEEHRRTTWERTTAGPVRCTGMRRAYQQAKATYKERRSG